MTDEWDEAFIEPDDGGGEVTAESDDQPEPKYPNVEEWVIGWFAPIIRRKLTGDHCWCPQWWQHPEVISRLDALWRSWEGLRLDATTGMSVWWRDHFGPHWAELVDRDRSPMSQCSPKDGHMGEHPELLVERAPANTWGPDTET